MKEAFIVDEEGFDEDPEEDQENKLEKFIQYIKDTKVVVLEDLAAHFQMKTDDTIDRVSTLIKEDKLTGISNKRIFYGAIFFIFNRELRFARGSRNSFSSGASCRFAQILEYFVMYSEYLFQQF